MVNLKDFGKEFGFQTHLIPSCRVSLESGSRVAVSSTLIRQQIMTCQFEKAQLGLGRWYDIPGQVVRGRGKGRQLGYPTANLELYSSDQLVPEDGVFAGLVRFGADAEQAWESEKIYPAAVSIGRAETFEDSTWQIEAHVLDFESSEDELYDQHMLVSPVERIRLQKKFAIVEELTEQIRTDCQDVRQVIERKGLLKS
jgi:riboflavin kinase/FMN adenylyltransferase